MPSPSVQGFARWRVPSDTEKPSTGRDANRVGLSFDVPLLSFVWGCLGEGSSLHHLHLVFVSNRFLSSDTDILEHRRIYSLYHR